MSLLTTHADYLYNWLKDFIAAREINEQCMRQIRSVLETICLIDEIEVDTNAWDNMILDLYSANQMEKYWFNNYDNFDSYMAMNLC